MLLVEADTRRRNELVKALCAAGIPVTAVCRIADLERWPAGEIVLVNSAQFTPWWFTAGASRVLVQVDTAEEGARLCERGASGWISRSSSGKSVVATLFATAAAVPADLTGFTGILPSS